MKAHVIEVVRGRDGKLYPAGLPRPGDAVNRLRRLEHALVCRDGLTIKAAQALLLEQYGQRRSAGAICQDLRLYECPECEGRGAVPLRAL